MSQKYKRSEWEPPEQTATDIARTIFEFKNPNHIIGYATAEQLRRCELYYSKPIIPEPSRGSAELPGSAIGNDTLVPGGGTRQRRVSELEDASNSSSMRTISPTIASRDSIYELFSPPRTGPAELGPEPEPAELSPESHPAELADTSIEKRLSWPQHDEAIDFFVNDLKTQIRRRKATKIPTELVESGTPVAELPGDTLWERPPTLTLNDEGSSQPLPQHVEDNADAVIDNAIMSWVQIEKTRHENESPLLADNWDLYESPATDDTRLDPQLLTPVDGKRSARVSGTWSEPYDEWEDAQEWQTADS